MATNTRHKLMAAKAVTDSARIVDSDTVWVEGGEVARALRAIRSQCSSTYPDVKAFTHSTGEADRVALRFK